MDWHTGLDLIGDPDVLKISASDVASDCPCGRHLAIKVRPTVESRAWRRFYTQGYSFPLGDLIKLVAAAHTSPETSTPTGLQRWLTLQLQQRRIHRLLRPYVTVAVENLLDAHDAIEHEIGSLRLIRTQAAVGSNNRQLAAWGPVYQTEDGVREIRRIRFGSAHEEPSEEDLRWAATAAKVAAGLSIGPPIIRVRAVEVGAVDGSTAVLFDDTPVAAEEAFGLRGKPRALALIQEPHVVPCVACKDCKIAGVCAALPKVDGMLGQADRGNGFRSISPSHLDQYRRCPAAWLLESDLHLPKGEDRSEAQGRGIAVHRWLEAAHKRGVRCTLSDLPELGGSLGLAASILSTEEYATARPYLIHHLDKCPLGDANTHLVAAEKTLYGLDTTAQVIAVTKADLIYRRGERLIVREVKTGASAPSNGRSEAYSRNFQIPFTLAMLEAGINTHHGVSGSTVEFELLTPEGSELWAWETDDELTMRVAFGDVRREVTNWHTDRTWDSKIGPHCEWCPVQRWCPDRDKYLDEQPAGTVAVTVDDLAGLSAHDLPPF